MNELHNGNALASGQKYLGKIGLILYIALMNMFIPLSTDLYLPALPNMNLYFGSTTGITNLTLSVFFACYATGMLFWGPLSDKYGRKPILVSGGIIYLSGSILCALSTNVYLLIIFRAVQGLGAGGITSVSTAIIKDCYQGRRRESILAISQTISGLAPMLAPVAGAILLQYTNWKGAFWTLSAIGILYLVLTLLFQETLSPKNRYVGTLVGSFARLLVVARNKSFFIPILLFALSSLPFMGYIALSSYIYIDYFGLSEKSYSYFFATNALITIIGPTIYVRFLSGMNKKLFASGCFLLSILSGLLVMAIGTLAPVLFLCSFLLFSLICTTIRPFSMNLLFEQQKGDSGSASSVINTMYTVFGCIGMLISSLSWGNIVAGLGTIIVLFSAISLIGWLLFLKSRIPCAGLK